MTTHKELSDKISMLEERIASLESKNFQAQTKTAKDVFLAKIRAELETKRAVVLNRFVKGDLLKSIKTELLKSNACDIIDDGVNTIALKREPVQFIKVPEKKVSSGIRKGILHPNCPKGIYLGIGNDHAKKICEVLDTGKKLTLKRCAKIINRSDCRTWYIIRDFVMKSGKYRMEKIGPHHVLRICLVDSKVQEPKKGQKQKPEVKHHYMTTKTDFQKFMSERIRYHMKNDGMNYLEASNVVKAEWSSRKAPAKQFPHFETIRPDFIPILKGVLEKLLKNGIPMVYREVSYSLDVQKESEFKALVEEIVTNWRALETYYGVSCIPKWDGFKLSLK